MNLEQKVNKINLGTALVIGAGVATGAALYELPGAILVGIAGYLAADYPKNS